MAYPLFLVFLCFPRISNPGKKFQESFFVHYQFFDISAYMWSACIAVHTYLAICKRIDFKPLESNFKYYAFVSYFPAIIVAIIPLIVHVYDNSYSEVMVWCWISDNHPFFRIAIYYALLFLVWLLTGGLYIAIRISVSKNMKHASYHANRRATLYLVLFFLTKMPGLLNRLIYLIIGEDIFILFLLQAIANPLQGFGNAIIYGMRYFLAC
jgi:hypothetical protein